MKKYVILFTPFLLLLTKTTAQSVGINNNTPNASAALDVTSTTQGVLIPRLTQAQRTAIAGPAKGLLVFDSTSKSFWFHDGTAWQEIGAATNVWKLTGNSGTDTATHFIGTADAMPLLFKVNNSKAGYIDYDEGSANTGFGYQVLYSNTEGYGNTAQGYQSLYNVTAAGSNTAQGYQSLYSNTLGGNNTAQGYQSLYSNTLGANNTAQGQASLTGNTTGANNTAQGVMSLFSNTTGANNTAAGYQSLFANVSGSYNAALGYLSLVNSTASYNTGVGSYALNTNSTGDHNTAVGFFANINNTTGSNNTAIGAGALVTSTGSGNTGLGQGADVSAGLSNCTALGYGAVVQTANQAIIGNTNVTSIGGLVGWSNFSDGRFKSNIKENVPGLLFINKLKPVTYNLDIAKINEFRGTKTVADNKATADMQQAEKIIRTGFVAQDVEKAAQDIGYQFDGVHHPGNSKDNYALVYADFVPSLVKALQELNNKVEEQQRQIDQLLKVIAEQKK